MISTPTVNSCQSTSRPASARPLRNTPTISAPISVPTIEPRPPNRLVPPITTAVIESRLAVWPACGLTAADAADQHPAGDRADQAGERVDRDQRAVGVDAGEARRIGIVAGGVDVAAEGGAVEHVPDDRREQRSSGSSRR